MKYKGWKLTISACVAVGLTIVALALLAGSKLSQASEWFVADDSIGIPLRAGFDSTNNLYYYDGELRIRTPSGVLNTQIGQTQPPFSTTGFSVFNMEVRDMAIAPDGAIYILIADNQGLSNTTIKLVGLQADHATVAPLQLTWSNLQSVRPTRIAVDASGNLFVLEANFLVFNGQQTTDITTVMIRKYSPAGVQLWSRAVNFLALFPSLVNENDKFPALMYINRNGTQLFIVDDRRLWIDRPNFISSRRNLLITGIDGTTGAVSFSKRIGDIVDPANHTVNDLSLPGGFFQGRPGNGDVDSAGNLLLIGFDEVFVNGAGPGQGGALEPYWLFMDKTGNIQWKRFVGQSLPASLAGIAPDFVPAGVQSAGQTLTPDGLLGVSAVDFGPQDNLFLTGNQNVTVTSGGATLQATEGYAAKYNLTTGMQWKALVAAQVAPAPGGNQVQSFFLTPEVDGLGNVYMGSGLYADSSFIFHRFIEKNPQNFRVELIQGVRNNVRRPFGKDGVSLVAGRDTVVRAFAELPSNLAVQNVTGLLCVDGMVASCPAARLFSSTGKAFPVNTAFTSAQLKKAENSINFFIKGAKANSLLAAGTHTFDVLVRSQTAGAFADIKGQVSASMQKSDSFRIFEYPIHLKNTAGQTISPDAGLTAKAADFIKRTYPVDEEQVQLNQRPAINFTGFPATTIPAKDTAQLNIVRKVQRVFLADKLFLQLTGLDAKQNFAAGVAPNLVNNSNPIGFPDPEESGLLGYTWPSIKGVVISLDRSPSAAPNNTPLLGSTIAHEMGHQFGFGEEYCYDDLFVINFPCSVDNNRYKKANPPPTAKTGDQNGTFISEGMGAFDVSGLVPNRKAIISTIAAKRYAYMGGGDDNNSWTTQTEYEFLFKQITNAPPPPPTTVRKVAAISGTLDINGNVTFDPLLTGMSGAPTDTPTGNMYALQFLDAGGGLLGSFGMDLYFEMEELIQGGSTHVPTTITPFGALTELPTGTSTIQLVQGATVLGQMVQSPHPPTVTITSLTTTANIAHAVWTGSDPDGDPLTYTVTYFYDGTTQSVLATDITTPSLNFDLSEFPLPDANAKVTVMASDGFNTGEASKALPSVLPVTLALNATAFNTGGTMMLTATTLASTPPTVADVYVALQLPDGTLLVMQPDGSFSTTLTPLLSNISVPNFNGVIFNYTFSGVEPTGNYTWFAALTQPGTLNIIGTLAVAPFSFAP